MEILEFMLFVMHFCRSLCKPSSTFYDEVDANLQTKLRTCCAGLCVLSGFNDIFFA